MFSDMKDKLMLILVDHQKYQISLSYCSFYGAAKMHSHYNQDLAWVDFLYISKNKILMREKHINTRKT